MSLQVSKVQALQQALIDREPVIVVTGCLARDLQLSRDLARISDVRLSIIKAALFSMPVSLQPNLIQLSVVARSAGLSTAALVAAAQLGLALVRSLWSDYDGAGDARSLILDRVRRVSSADEEAGHALSGGFVTDVQYRSGGQQPGGY